MTRAAIFAAIFAAWSSTAAAQGTEPSPPPVKSKKGKKGKKAEAAPANPTPVGEDDMLPDDVPPETRGPTPPVLTLPPPPNVPPPPAPPAHHGSAETIYALRTDCSQVRGARARELGLLRAHRWEHRETYTLIFDGASRTYIRPLGHTYANTLVRVCIQNPDYRMRYHLSTAAPVALPPPSPDMTGMILQQQGQAPKTETTLDLTNLRPTAEVNLLWQQGTDSQQDIADLINVANHKTAQVADAVAKATKELTDLDKGDDPTSVRTQIARVEAVAHELAQDLAIFDGEAAVIASTLTDVRDRLAPEARIPLEQKLLNLGNTITQQMQSWSDTLDDADNQLTKAQDQLALVKKQMAANDPKAANNQVADDSITAAQKTSADLRQKIALLQVQIASTRGLEQQARWAYDVAVATLNHFETVGHNVFYVPVEKDTEVEVSVKMDRLRLPTEPQASPSPSPVAQAGYDAVADAEFKQKFQVRSLTWFRINLGLAFTSLRSAAYTLGNNDVGAQVIVHGNDPGIVPMFVLSHYWCGVDLREIQPYHRFSRCGWANTLLPTVALGIPLSRNPVQNLFIGGMWQPVPGLAFIFGAHLGEVTVLRHGFVEGQPPPLVQGQVFDVQTAQEDRLRLGYFVGFAITDSIFVPFIAKLAGLK